MTATALALLLLFASSSRADVVQLVNGKALSGIVTRRTESELDLQVDEEGTVTIATDTIKSVEMQAATDNKELKAKWRADRIKQEADEAEKRRYAEAQRAKGLVLYEDEWMTPAEAKQRLAVQEAEERRSGGSPRVYMAQEGTPSVVPAPKTTGGHRGSVRIDYYYHTNRSRVIFMKDGQVQTR
jgi:hypothetical protein